jgi:alpha-L-rhamnosidase
MLRAIAAAAAAVATAAAAAPTPGNISEPYAWLHSGAYTGPPAPASVDPLVRFQWDADAPYQAMQVYGALPAWVAAAPLMAASGLETLTYGPYGGGAATVTGNVSLMVSFGVELAGWLEFTFAGGARLPACVGLTATISEYNSPRPGAPIAPVFYAGTGTPDAGAYRLETNKQLYDGLRYAWLYLSFPPGCAAAPVSLAGVRAVAQVLPLNYTGSFASSDSVLDRIWYTGAYATRVNALPGFFGSELLDRGDRSPPFQGDDHVAQAVGLAAFASLPLYALARTMLNFTDSAAHSVHDSNIVTYPLMWVLSVVDYFTATGDAGLLAGYAPDVATILDGAIADFQKWDSPSDLRWSGWDDRLGSGFVDVDQTPEARRFYWTTTLRAAARFAEAAGKAGAPLAPFATKYAAARDTMLAALRAPGPDWWVAGGYGLHAAAAAVNSGALTAAEQAGMFAALFNDR